MKNSKRLTNSSRAHSVIIICAAVLIGMSFSTPVRGQSIKDTLRNIGERIFLPSVEVGFMHHQSEQLSTGLLIKSSIEYRWRNNNDVFTRLSYDAYNVDYSLDSENGLSNVIKGTAAINDLMMGFGYRFGDHKYRIFLMVQPGVKFYNYPTTSISQGVVNIEQSRKGVFITRTTLGFEYYFDQKSAITLDIFQGQVWKQQDFWTNTGSAFGASIGFITSLL